MDNAAYSEAVQSGQYAKQTGLQGKYDNVRLCWEDEITRRFIRPYLAELAENRKNKIKRLRIIDIGCGSSDGFELLMGTRHEVVNLTEHAVQIISPDILGEYVGVDLNADLLKQAEYHYGNNPKTRFEQADFREFFQDTHEPPFDLYFSSYGTFSHLNQEDTVKILSNIARHAKDGALVIFDWLGRYSYEWQTLWGRDNDGDETWMSYEVNYIYSEEERKNLDLIPLNLRLVTPGEIENLVEAAEEESGVELKLKEVFDRSLLVGRHIDTKLYNPYCAPMRSAVNGLFESNLRNDLYSLLFDYQPDPGFPFANVFFEKLQMCWNMLVQFTVELLLDYNVKAGRFGNDHPIPPDAPPQLRQAMEMMRRIIEGTAWLTTGDVRANIIEHQLGYALRYLESSLQEGKGFGHSIAAVIEVKK